MTDQSLNISANRKAIKYSRVEISRRVLWSIASVFFRLSPRICFGWRRFLLRLFGAKIEEHVHIYNSAIIYMPWNLKVGRWSSIGEHVFVYNLGAITIGEKVTVSHRVHLCAGTHDYTDPTLPLLKPSIVIGDQAWICADAFIGPGVVVAEGCVVGARTVVTKNLAPWSVVAGNPAKFIKNRTIKEKTDE